MKFIDTYNDILHYFHTDKFDINTWYRYSKSISPYLQEKVEKDIADYDFNTDILPVIKAALENKNRLKTVHNSFQTVIKNIEKDFAANFGTDLSVDIILYLGLCSGAGWATSLGEKKAILLGIEKIIELDWCDEKSMFALISHEIGHIWHMDVGGVFHQQSTAKEKAVFQLYSEGVAMLCEQKLCGNDNYYHQNTDGWLEWCENNLGDIKNEYSSRVQNDASIQDFFGDWCNYKGYSDVGYYLGCQFVRFILNKYTLLQMACLKNDMLIEEFILFTK